MTSSLAHTLCAAAVYVLAVMRVVRLINHDTIFDPVRVAVVRRKQDPDRSEVERGRWGTFQLFLSCPWCVSIWVVAGTAWLPIYFADNPVVRYVGVILAVSMIVGLLAGLSADDEIDYEPVDNASHG